MAMNEKGDADRQNITFVESDESLEEIQRRLGESSVKEVDLFVRRPDNINPEEYVVAASLCSCRRVCVVFVEPK